MSSTVKNYTEQGGERTIIGGELVIEEGAQITGLPSSDVPVATADTPGIVKPGSGLTVDGEGALSVTGGGGGGGASVVPIILNMGGVDLGEAFRKAVDVTSTVSVSKFLQATECNAPILINNVFWGNDLYSCQAVSCRKRSAITCLGAAVDQEARLTNVVTGIIFMGDDRVYLRARLLLDDELPVESVSLDKTGVTLEPGETVDLTAYVTPPDAFDTSVYWSSSSERIAAIISGEYDSTVIIEAGAPGIAEITVTTYDGGYTASCEVIVTGDPDDGGGDGGDDPDAPDIPDEPIDPDEP